MMHRDMRPGEHASVGLNGMIFLSLMFHILVLSLLVIPRSLSAPKWTLGPVYSVQLVSMPADFRGRKDAKLSYNSYQEITGGNDAFGPTLLKKESIDTLPLAPIVSVKTGHKPVNDIDRVLDSIRKKTQTKESHSASGTASRGTEHITSQTSQSQTGQGGEINAKINDYYRLIWARIKGRWSLPQGILPRGNIEAVVHLQILLDGSVASLGFEKRSGNRYFDESVMRAVKKASPLPPLPEEIRDGNIEIGIRFHLSELR